MNLASLDLNLLVLLDALLEECNVTRAGARVGLSQPAASNGLKRLRLLLGDPLLERDGRRLRLTGRAHELKMPLNQALDAIRKALDHPPPFDPATARFQVRLFASDHIVLVLLPVLQRRLQALAPQAEIIVHWTDHERVIDLLADGVVDLAIGRYFNTPGAIRRAKLYDESLVVQARRGHPAFEGELTAEGFAAWPRIATSFDGRIFGDQEQAMARAGIEVRAAVVLPHLVAAPMLTLESDLLTIAPERMARRLAALLELDWRPLPFPAPTVPIEMIWHETSAADPALAWARSLILQSAGET